MTNAFSDRPCWAAAALARRCRSSGIAITMLPTGPVYPTRPSRSNITICAMFTMDTMLSWDYGAGPVTADDARDRSGDVAVEAARGIEPLYAALQAAT